MATKDQMVASITHSRKAAKLRRRETLPDNEWWAEIRDEEIRPELERAEAALNETGIGGKYERRNGGSGVALLVGESESSRHLTFSHVSGGIQVTSSERHFEERWDDRKHVTADSVGSKVLEFLVWIARDHPEDETSVYDQRLKAGKPVLETF